MTRHAIQQALLALQQTIPRTSDLDVKRRLAARYRELLALAKAKG